jgi:DNA-directed RNA polymerase specialized sigma24 family protein
LCFPAIYQKWWRGRVLERSFGDLAADLPNYAQVSLHQPDPADEAANRVDAERLLMQIPEPARTGLWLRGVHGATQAEAAAAVGLTSKQLERRIGQARENLGLTRSRPPKPDRDRAAAPEPEAELDDQEGDRDR